MVTRLVPGARTWSMTRAEDAHREYKVKYLIQGAVTDGPANALTTPGLPLPGSQWIIENDIDIWAWCRWNATVTPVLDKEPNSYFEVELTFSTKQESKNCHTEQITDPLLDPQKISGSFTRYTEEATRDRFGKPITNSCHEELRGPKVEFDANRPQIKIEQNVAILGIEIFAPMIDTVNEFPLWGLPPRTIKLSTVSWERKFHDQCNVYYTRTLDFDVNYKTFDRVLMDEGTQVLNGHWDTSGGDTDGNWVLEPIKGQQPDPSNPTHFIKATGRDGNPKRIVLNGRGLPATRITGTEELYISIVNGNTDDLSSGNWVPVTDPTDINVWQLGKTYVVGDLVTIDTGDSLPQLYICTESFTEEVPGTSDDWLHLGTSVTGSGLGGGTVPNDAGDFVLGSTYAKGDYVKDAGSEFSVGKISVQYYQESDFLALMIPTSF